MVDVSAVNTKKFSWLGFFVGLIIIFTTFFGLVFSFAIPVFGFGASPASDWPLWQQYIVWILTYIIFYLPTGLIAYLSGRFGVVESPLLLGALSGFIPLLYMIILPLFLTNNSGFTYGFLWPTLVVGLYAGGTYIFSRWGMKTRKFKTMV